MDVLGRGHGGIQFMAKAGGDTKSKAAKTNGARMASPAIWLIIYTRCQMCNGQGQFAKGT